MNNTIREAYTESQRLLRDSYQILKDSFKDEKCDHSVNICFCHEHRVLGEIKQFLNE